MSAKSSEILTGCLLCFGGGLAGYAHAVHPMDPADPALLFQHAAKTQSTHTVLFAGVFVLLIALRGRAGQVQVSSPIVPIGTLLLSTGILLSDMLHCVLEFSIFPMLMRSIPYAAVAMVEATYHSVPLSLLQSGGQWLLALGAFMTSIGLISGPSRQRWTALPLCLSGALMGSALLRLETQSVEPQFIVWIYFSIALLGVRMLSSALFENGSHGRGHQHSIGQEEEEIRHNP